MKKNCSVKEIRENQQVAGRFMVREMARAETRTGKPYLNLTLMDASGEISGRVWENADQLMEQCPAGAIVAITGLAQSYKNILQLRIDSIERVSAGEADLSLFVPSTRANIKLMAQELIRLAASVENPFLKELLMSLFGERRLMTALKKAPAAKNMHHAYLGGLLEHTLAVTRLADQVCGLYPGLDRSLLLAGALLHDLGKLKEFDFSSFPFEYTDHGRLVGHMVLAIEMIQDKISRIPAFPQELAAQLKHLILSHHGRHEFGSPSLPMMREAFVLNFLDDLDAKINYLDRLSSQCRSEGYQWTEYQRNLERFLFVRGHAAAGPAPTAEGDNNGADPRQRNLFGFSPEALE